ncbi:MAG: hypothetical protein L6V86_07115 [Treponema sp.]|nr:MAG: hypothetical protein L6V86_07115 [Treponema sp.]
MKKLNLFLLVAGFFVFSSCTERLEHNEEKSSGNVVINLSSVNAERGAVPKGYSSVDISKVEKWTLTFSLVSPFDEFPAETRTITRDSNSVTIGVGEYDLFVEGSYTEQGVIYNLSGACSGIVVEEGNKNTVPVSVLVGPKKTTNGKGSFSAEMSFEKVALSTYYKTIGLTSNDTTDKKSKRFKAELVSKKTGEIVYSTHSGEKLLVADVVSTDSAGTGDSYVTVESAQTESEPNKISSGFYYFHFYADFAPVKPNEPSAEITPDWKEVSIGDNLVEIGDELSTSMSRTSLSFPDDTATYYYYYASDAGSKDNNGISRDAPGELYTVLDTIYDNPMVQNARVDYTYKDSIKFDVSKIGSGKTVEIRCNKDPQVDDIPSFTLNKDSSVLFNMHAESITLTSTGDAKSVKIKEYSSGSLFSLEDGVYLDLTSLTAEELCTLSLGFWIDDNNVDYYKNNPMMVSSVSLGTVQGAYYRFSFYGDDSQFPSETYSYNKDAVFTYNMKEVPGSDTYNYFAEEPAYGSVVYYSNDSSRALYKIELENNNGVYADITYPDYENPDPAALASWCDDGNNGFYVFEIRDIQNPGTYKQMLPANPVYNIRHFEKIKKGTSFIFNQTKIDCNNIKNIPVSMCTDGTNIYYVQSNADISMYGGQPFELYKWGHWAYRDNKVKYFSVEDPSAPNELDFSKVFTDGKVTAVYYYNNELYVAGYKKDYIGSVSENQDQSAQGIKFYNCTYSVYKLSDPKNVTTAELVSDVFDSSGEKDRDPDILEFGEITDNDRIIAYSAITDMAIVDGNLYVLENSYYRTSSYGYGYRGSLRQVSLENGNVLKVLDKNSSNKKVGLPYKIIAVLPKKLKISDNKKKYDSQQNSTYDVDLSASDLSLEEKGSVSSYYFDNYGDAASSLILSDTFKTEGIYTEPSKKDIENNAFTPN